MALSRSNSISGASQGSQTAQDYIQTQLQLEAEAREALPYQFDTCTRPLGPLRQTLFSCLTCNPPPKDTNAPYTAAGICYSCSISCHGEHELVELFGKRNFECDCGTTRLPESVPCTLRINAATGLKGGVTGEEPRKENKYNKNFRNRFCGCDEEYDPHTERGTMFQCLGLGTVEDGGCGEDWWHPECIVGMERKWYEKEGVVKKPDNRLGSIKEEEEAETAEANPTEHAPNGTVVDTAVENRVVDTVATMLNGNFIDSVAAVLNGDANGNTAELHAEGEANDDDDPPLPPGFPNEDAFEYLLCYKCVEAFPWVKRYAGAPGFLPAVPYKPGSNGAVDEQEQNASDTATVATEPAQENTIPDESSKKRKAEDDEEQPAPSSKRQRSTDGSASFELVSRDTSTMSIDPVTPDAPVSSESAPPPPSTTTSTCTYSSLPPATTGRISLFLTSTFRDHICRCPSCFPNLASHPQLLEEETSYSPPVSEAGDGTVVQGSGTGSLLERGEAALSTMDRVRAIEGITAYNHVRDKVKAFLKPYAESGQMVSAEDVKKYFEGLRGDVAAAMSGNQDGAVEGDNRREQSGY